MSRRWLVVVSLVAHAAVGMALFVSGVWNIEQVEAGRMPVHLARPVSPPEPAPGGPVAVKGPDFTPKERKEIAKVPTQPEPPKDNALETSSTVTGTETAGTGPGTADSKGTCTENCGETPAVAVVCGDRSQDLSEQCDDGNTVNGDGCSSTCRLEPPPEPKLVIPTVLQGLRISGETQIHPSSATQQQMVRDTHRMVNGSVRVSGGVKVCLAASGNMSSVEIHKSTGYPDYDATILSAVRHWRYRPYTINGKPVPACSMVTFLYSIQGR